ncbi:MAG: hypothetical protein ACK5LR_01060 [Mangrovibacterium sp.]
MNNQERLQQAQHDFIQSLPENFCILEEAIDVEVQYEYFDFNSKIKPIKNNEQYDAAILSLSGDDLSLHRTSLSQLAKTERAEVYQIIVNYREQCTDKKMKAWATLAMQESRMVLESELLSEEHPIFISTGLGGKGQNIRFFISFILRDQNGTFTPTQKKLVKGELSFQLQENKGELERIRFTERFATCTFLYPLKAQLEPLITNVITECNLYGNFLREELIITNVRKIPLNEIRLFVAEQEKKEAEKQ